MALTKQKKEEILKDLNNSFASAQSLVFVHFKKLSVADATELRNALRAEGSSYQVVKKTLLKRVLDGKYEGALPDLGGETAVAWSDTDPLATARIIHEFAKTHKEMINIIGGVFEGKYADEKMMKSVATIPGREVLYAQLAFLIKSPIQKFAIAISEVAKSKE